MRTLSNLDIISLKLPHKMVVKLDSIAKKNDRNRSSLIRNLLAQYIEDYEDVRDALKAHAVYKKNPKSAASLDKIMRDMKITKNDLSKIDLKSIKYS